MFQTVIVTGSQSVDLPLADGYNFDSINITVESIHGHSLEVLSVKTNRQPEFGFIRYKVVVDSLRNTFIPAFTLKLTVGSSPVLTAIDLPPFIKVTFGYQVKEVIQPQKTKPYWGPQLQTLLEAWCAIPERERASHLNEYAIKLVSCPELLSKPWWLCAPDKASRVILNLGRVSVDLLREAFFDNPTLDNGWEFTELANMFILKHKLIYNRRK